LPVGFEGVGMVSRRTLSEPFDGHPIARESLVAVVALGTFGLWVDFLSGAIRRYVPIGAIDAPGSSAAELALTSVLNSVLLLVGMGAFVYAYRRLRSFDGSLAWPDGDVLRQTLLAVGCGVSLVAVVQAVATLTGGSLGAAAGTAYSPKAAVGIAALVTALGLLVAVPAFVVVAHVLVQDGLRRRGRPVVGIALATLVVGLVGPTGLLRLQPLRFGVVTLLVALAIALPVVATERFDHGWLTALTSVPLLVLVLGATFERFLTEPALVSTAYRLVEVAFVAVATIAYERTGSVVPSALGYASFVVTTEAVVFAVEAGLPI
jgi:hypothetical protein